MFQPSIIRTLPDENEKISLNDVLMLGLVYWLYRVTAHDH